MLQTERLGKTFEMAVCLKLGTPFVGKYPYSHEEAYQLVNKMQTLTPDRHYIHTAAKGARYDFTSGDRHMSVKTTRKDMKIAPQCVGQASPKTFCERMDIPYIDVATLKEYFQSNEATILSTLEDYTFDCPILYYNQSKDTIQYIKQIQPIDWTNAEYIWTRNYRLWKNSSTLKRNGISILEVQFHSRSRANMAVRWCFENVLNMFPSSFRITLA